MSETPPDSGTTPFLQRFVAAGQAVAEELGLDHRTVDVKFLGFLRETSRFGVFSLGPLTIHLARVEELMQRTTSKEGERLSAEEEAAFDEFFALMAQEQGKRGGTTLTELDVLLAFMRMSHGLPARVFGELGVTPERVADYVAGAGAGTQPAAVGALESLYSPEEAAEYLGVHVETVRSWIRSGRLRAHRLAGQRALRIRASDLSEVLEPVDAPGDD